MEHNSALNPHLNVQKINEARQVEVENIPREDETALSHIYVVG